MSDTVVENMHDVTVRIPVHFEHPETMAGFVERAVAVAMKKAGYIGTPFVMWKDEATGDIHTFIDGLGIDNHYDGVLPHGLVKTNSA